MDQREEKDMETKREDRLENGTYKPVPFAKHDAWLRIVAANPDHFVHVSRKKTARLAYTESTKKGEGDVQTPIAFADYMARFGDAATSEEKDELASIMRYFLTVYLDNAAFEDDARPELQRILHIAAERVDALSFTHGRAQYALRDINGSIVGHFGYEHEESENE